MHDGVTGDGPPGPPPAAVILAGGGAGRLGGVDKPALEIGGRSLLRRAVEAAGAGPVVVVGPRRSGFPDVLWAREHPAGGGPLAALAAGLAALPTGSGDRVVVLAADLAGVTPSTVARLARALGNPAGTDPARPDGAVLVDAGGREQWLIGVWRAGSLRAALPGDPAGRSLRATFAGLTIAGIPALPGEAADVDTPEDLARARGVREAD
ncbi:molybdopterin-guanine dinucleotide biosynthesis protein MobA [Amycolatopsis antarctica]|uniref:Molybdopterin-guanine dinucleotide biosynthesis protein MobA n=1 Tax=Amycolatopsis antarctica TaxID=1854586 RepID=A0A263D235_9PSEU|nr:nucleotidyltransferase family protein [Amycolatopsis antarctica]OZM72513.1 molybdopterin-guanine dinucleotide biosynthesis protein MobA [Amycolatopsis antarctica]